MNKVELIETVTLLFTGTILRKVKAYHLHNLCEPWFVILPRLERLQLKIQQSRQPASKTNATLLINTSSIQYKDVYGHSLYI
jgi:hypothetical protein